MHAFALDEKKFKSNIKMLTPLYNFACKFHDYSIEGLEKIPNNKNYILAVNHSLATYDIALFAGTLYYSNNILARPILDNLILKTPFLNKIFSVLCPVPVDINVLKCVLEQGQTIIVAPGGMKEALRSSEQKYSVCWDNRKGFIKLSLLSGKPIVLAASPKSDDLYEVQKSMFTELIYENLKIPFPFAKGKNSFLPFIPKKIKITHHIGGPFYPPAYSDDKDLLKKVDEFHAFICEKMKKLLSESQ